MLPINMLLGSGGKGGTDEMEQSFPPLPESAPEARSFVLSVSNSQFEAVDSRLSALVSELATNAILHARTPFRVKVSADDFRIRVAVSDQSPVTPIKRSYEPSHATGRGLVIVESLADRWGVSTNDEGKTVWFEIDHEGEPT